MSRSASAATAGARSPRTGKTAMSSPRMSAWQPRAGFHADKWLLTRTGMGHLTRMALDQPMSQVRLSITDTGHITVDGVTGAVGDGAGSAPNRLRYRLIPL